MGEFKKLGIEQARLPDNQCYRWEKRKIQKIKEGPKFIPWRWKSHIIVS